MGICSITPRIDYSQGNDWFYNLRTLGDLHKPSLSGIGFQELIAEQMAHWDSLYNGLTHTFEHRSAGKQPAWVNYMTSYNRVYGTFADTADHKTMVLLREYEKAFVGAGEIGDLTTYIDPKKYNYAFTVSNLTAQNFWVQIGCNIIARRKMSAKIIPNL